MFSKCCCCVPLRTGSIVLAIIGLLYGIVPFTTPEWISMIGFWLWKTYILGALYLFGYAALLFGALKYNDKAVLVNLVCTPIIIVLTTIMGIWLIVEIVRFEMVGCLECWVQLVLLIVSAFLNGYFWLCNYSFYKELKGGNENPA